MQIEFSLIMAFGAMLCWGIGDFLIQRSTWKIGPVGTLTVIGVIGTIGLFPFAAPELGALFDPHNFLLLAALGIITYAAAIFNFEALNQGKLSVVEIMLQLELMVTVFLGVFFLKESLSMPQILGITAVFIGVIFIAVKSLSIRQLLKNVEKGVFLGLAAAIGMGFINYLTGIGAKTISPVMAIWAPWAIYTLICIIYLVATKSHRTFMKDFMANKKLLIMMGTFDTAAWLFYAFATENAEISITTAITESYPALAIFFGIWLNRERIAIHQLAGAALALSASIWLASTI